MAEGAFRVYTGNGRKNAGSEAAVLTHDGAGHQLKPTSRRRPKTLHIRGIAVCDRPVAAAIERIDQRVASLGVVYSVRSITSATYTSDIVRGDRDGIRPSAPPSGS